MPDGTTIEIPLTRSGDTGPSHVRLRRFLVNWEPHRALALGIAQGNLPALGEPFIFDTGELYCGSHVVEAIDESPEYTRVDAVFVRKGELRYEKLPSEVGYRTLAVTVGSAEVSVPLIKKYPIGASGAFEYVTNTIAYKRRETVALVTRNILTADFTAASYAALSGVLNYIVDTSVGADPWVFESFTANELSDRVTQLVGAFRSTPKMPARPAPTTGTPPVPVTNRPFDIDLPELPPFANYVVLPGPPENFGEPVGSAATDPIIVVNEPYTEPTATPIELTWFLPIFQAPAP